MNYNLFYVDPKTIDIYWKKLNLEKAINHSHMTIDDLKDSIIKGYCDLFLIKGEDLNIYGAGTIRVYDSFGGRVLEIVTLHGIKMNDWLDKIYTDLENIARKCECSRVSIVGRDGWIKVMKKFNFEKKAVVLEKVL